MSNTITVLKVHRKLESKEMWWKLRRHFSEHAAVAALNDISAGEIEGGR